jgi:hypothetical protein
MNPEALGCILDLDVSVIAERCEERGLPLLGC